MVNFASIAADSHQAGNPAGARRVAILLAKAFTANWPVAADIVAGEITTLTSTVLEVATEWPVYECPQNTISFDDENTGSPGFQSFKQMVELQLAGFSKENQVELAKHLNAGSVVLVELNDGQWACVGASYNPIFLQASGKSGSKGSDARGKTLKGEQEGFMFGVTPVAAAVITDITFAAVA
jgi:hypothetical protein